jgi:hypothetical protein
MLKLCSPLPFSVLKSSVLPGPYTNHFALLIRQENTFRFLALPLHIRTKIYALIFTHLDPAIPIVMKGSTRGVWSPTYHAPNKLALLRTCQQIHTWLAGIDREDPPKGLGILVFDERGFHVRVDDKKAGGFRVTVWGPAEQLAFFEG